MKKTAAMVVLMSLVCFASFGYSPFSEEEISVDKTSGSTAVEALVEESYTVESAEQNSAEGERLSSGDLDAQIDSFLKTLELLKKFPDKMQQYIKDIDKLEADLSGKLLNEINYGVGMIHNREMQGQDSAKVLASKAWTDKWVDALNHMVLASDQFRKLAVSQSENYSPQTTESTQETETPPVAQSSQDTASGQPAPSATSVDSAPPQPQKQVKPDRIDSIAISERGQTQMRNVVSYAMGRHRGASRGMCFNAVWGYLSGSGYGNIKAWGDLPRMKSGLARYFADYMNAGQANLNEAGLQRLDTALKPPITNPHDSRIPVGAVIVVAAGSTGTADPVAGDIVVKGNGRFINDGPDMWYGDSASWRGKLLGVYVPR